ncbi:ZPR1 zinc finger domain-containing protein [Methanocella conradii]|uniref:ZPR1 zinc finger domain-containing protein n=1 Tax=Methanocella conradii TaxID=1175444 RepID=UPI00157C724E|nr:ZPR1 zinc finger domain-containing protein [Methanocella conradii]
MRDSGVGSSESAGLYNCPACGSILEMRGNLDNIPYFGDVMEISLVCDCGFKFVDTIILGQKEPVRYLKRVCSEGDLWTRVIRSTSGTIRIPEWGVEIEPGPASEAYITNVEGVIERLQSVVEMARKWSETEDERRRAESLLDTMQAARDGKPDFTIIIEDPLGNSAFIGEGVEVAKLTDEEARSLRTGMFIVQK